MSSYDYNLDDVEDCPVCDGEGLVWDNFHESMICLECNGSGLLVRKKANPYKKDEKQLTIYEIMELTAETEIDAGRRTGLIFSKGRLKFYRQKLTDFRVKRQTDSRYYICAIEKDHTGKKTGLTERYFNPLTNKLERQ